MIVQPGPLIEQAPNNEMLNVLTGSENASR